jgi:two-component system, chemotaxis family, sensor kinase CheA
MINEFHQQYTEEAKILLKDLEHSLLQLEKSEKPEEVNNVYRYLHTLKGSAGMFGFASVERLSHQLENVFDEVREGVRQVDALLLDLALHAVDVLRDLIDGNNADSDADKIIESIQGFSNAAATTEVLSGITTDRGEQKAFVIFLHPEREIFRRGVNLTAMLEELRDLGNCQWIVHDETIPFEKQIADREIVSWLEVFLGTNVSAQEVADVFMFMKPAEYTVVAVDGVDVFSDAAYSAKLTLDATSRAERIALIERVAPGSLSAKAPAVTAPQEPIEAEDQEEVRIAAAVRKRKKDVHISVASNKLDHLINIVSELVIFRSEIQHLMEDSQNPAVVEALEKLERLTLGLRDTAFNIRLVPLSVLNVKLQRLVRGLTKELGKDVEFITEGLDTELDRSMISALEAPLIHLIRNALDHGIESPEERERRNKPKKGLVKLYSYNSGDHVFIQLQDDGNGIDFDKVREKAIVKGLLHRHQSCSEKELLNIMMTPGFSTASTVTTVSGRGVGLDVVKKEINALRGDIEVSTEKGLGSIFTLRLPLTLTVLDTLVVKVHDSKYLIPISEVEHCYKEQHESLFGRKSRQIRYDGQILPFVSLREQFNIEAYPQEETVIVVNKNDRRMAVVVDSIEGTLQTVYKPLNELLHPADCFSGASILGDGSMALIINALKLSN